jgi:glyoxylase-like metal-dependent hydrolase (beta-lactamase superfamily II)
VLDFDFSAGRTTTENINKILSYVNEHKLKIEWILETHVHADHITGAAKLRESHFPGVKIGIGAGVVKVQETFQPLFNLQELKTDGSQFDKLFADGDLLTVGHLVIKAIFSPGHTADSTAYHVQGLGIFLGDTMFYPDKGTARCDFPNGSAELLYSSIQRILSYPDDTKLFICHDYPGNAREFKWETSVAEQKAHNIHLQPGSNFVEMRTTRDATLKIPHLLIPSVQLNLDAGKFPAPEQNGTSYIKVPLNYF